MNKTPSGHEQEASTSTKLGMNKSLIDVLPYSIPNSRYHRWSYIADFLEELSLTLSVSQAACDFQSI